MEFSVPGLDGGPAGIHGAVTSGGARNRSPKHGRSEPMGESRAGAMARLCDDTPQCKQPPSPNTGARVRWDDGRFPGPGGEHFDKGHG